MIVMFSDASISALLALRLNNNNAFPSDGQPKRVNFAVRSP